MPTKDDPGHVARFGPRELKDVEPVSESSAMTIIRTTCPTCGEVDMRADAVLLQVFDEDSGGRYSFVCPRCGEAVEKMADRTIVALLVSAGVDVEDRKKHPSGGSADAGLAPCEGIPAGRPFTLDDLIDFHFLLEDDQYIEESLSSSV
jgi:predicted RNA-binding Zn-ribbon protein involved in translation (DUF1610 family)